MVQRSGVNVWYGERRHSCLRLEEKHTIVSYKNERLQLEFGDFFDKHWETTKRTKDVKNLKINVKSIFLVSTRFGFNNIINKPGPHKGNQQSK